MPGEPDDLESTLTALILEEEALTRSAGKRLGSFALMGARCVGLINTFVEKVEHDRFLAAALLLSIQKVATLGYLSLIRNHLSQSQSNTRQLVEYCVLACYLLVHPETEVTRADLNHPNRFLEPKVLSKRAYAWLDNHFPVVSKALYNEKKLTNDSTSHASVYQTVFTFNWEHDDERHFTGSFFDQHKPEMIQTFLVSFGRTVLTVIEAIRLVADQHGGLLIRHSARAELLLLGEIVDNHRDHLIHASAQPNKPG